jgi:hypothetical protein
VETHGPRGASRLLESRRSDGRACARASAAPVGTRTEGGQRARSATKLGSYQGTADYQSAAQRTMTGRSHPTPRADGGDLRARHVVFSRLSGDAQ